MLVLNEVTHGDQGLYAIKLPSGFTYETVHLTVSGMSFSFYSFAIDVKKNILFEIKFPYSKSSSVKSKVFSDERKVQKVKVLFCREL